MSNQNDDDIVSKLETDELATDLLSAIKEFEETTAKITSAHQTQDIQTNQMMEETQQQIVQSTICQRTEEKIQADDKGPIDYFVRTKETLRHVPQMDHDINNNLQKSRTSINCNDDNDESGDAYVKIPVQQLINTFEKQMRSIIKQKINENIQVKSDGTATCTKPIAQPSNTYSNKEPNYDFAGKDNEESKPFEQFANVMSSSTVDNDAYMSQQQTFNRIERQVTHSSDEQYQWSTQTTNTKSQTCDENKQSIFSESANKQFNNFNQLQPDDHLDGGKAITTFNFLPVCIYCSLMSLLTTFNCLLCELMISK